MANESLITQMTNWVNQQTYFTRQELLEAMPKGNQGTIDTYRNYMTQAKYLKIISRGKYRRIKDLPNMPVSKLMKEAYSRHSKK